MQLNLNAEECWESAMVTTILCLLVALAAVFITVLAQRIRASPTRVVPHVEAAVVGGAIINFFDTLGIGSFAPTTAYLKFRKLVPDRLIPPTLIAASALPSIAEALIFIRVIKVEPTLLVVCIAAAVFGSWLGSTFALSLPAKPIRLTMGVGLLIAAVLMTLSNLGRLPVGGSALELDSVRMAVAAAACFVFGGLMNLGIGMYAPSLIVLSLLGLEPRAVFPIMMGACAFLTPITGVKILRHPEIDLRIILGIAIGAIPAILIAAYVVKEIPLHMLRWLVIAIVLYAGGLMLRAGLRQEARQEVADVSAAT
jgi:uncharacterized membrane protein YfcA